MFIKHINRLRQSDQGTQRPWNVPQSIPMKGGVCRDGDAVKPGAASPRGSRKRQLRTTATAYARRSRLYRSAAGGGVNVAVWPQFGLRDIIHLRWSFLITSQSPQALGSGMGSTAHTACGGSGRVPRADVLEAAQGSERHRGSRPSRETFWSHVKTRTLCRFIGLSPLQTKVVDLRSRNYVKKNKPKNGF